MNKTIEKIAILRLDISGKKSIIRELEDDQSKIEHEITKLVTKMTWLESDHAIVVENRKVLKSEINPYDDLLLEKVNRQLALEHDLSGKRDAFEKLQSQHMATSYWPKGFKQIRLFIIERAFQTLEVEVNNCLAQLGMLDWQVTFDVERENKAGGITKGFIVLIKGPSNPKPVRWENWSGGETQRLQLAGDLGLSNLIMHQAGLESGIEFFDEPSTHLSSEGMMNLADMLHDRAVTERKAIWIADHTSISNFGEFEGVILARKTKNGSNIQCSGA